MYCCVERRTECLWGVLREPSLKAQESNAYTHIICGICMCKHCSHMTALHGKASWSNVYAIQDADIAATAAAAVPAVVAVVVTRLQAACKQAAAATARLLLLLPPQQTFALLMLLTLGAWQH